MGAVKSERTEEMNGVDACSTKLVVMHSIWSRGKRKQRGQRRKERDGDG